MLVELLEQSGLLDGGSGGAGFEVRAVVLDFIAALMSCAGTVVVQRDGGGDDLNEAEDGLVVLSPKFAEGTAVVLAETEVGLLDEVVDERGAGSAYVFERSFGPAERVGES